MGAGLLPRSRLHNQACFKDHNFVLEGQDFVLVTTRSPGAALWKGKEGSVSSVVNPAVVSWGGIC